MEKTLILIRHAHRDKKQGREVDNGLSPKGRKQARKVAKHFWKAYPKSRPLVVSSPKLRCLETLLPLVKNKKDDLVVLGVLDEGTGLKRRAKVFVRWWKKDAPELTVACSHGDWLPIAIEELTGASVELDKGAWAEIQIIDGKPSLTWLKQRL